MSALQSENRPLSALPAPDFARLLARMDDVTFNHKELAYRAGGPIDYVYFPRSGVLSAVIVMEDGASAETAAIGREGMTGVATFLGNDRSREQVVCQIAPCRCRRLLAAEFVAEVANGGAMGGVAYWYVRSVLTVAARQTACNCLRSADERCARWILGSRDRVGADESRSG